MIINSQIPGSSGGVGSNIKITVNFSDLYAGLLDGEICTGYKDIFGNDITFPLTCTANELYTISPVITNDLSVLKTATYLEVCGIDMSGDASTGNKCINNTSLKEIVFNNISLGISYVCQGCTSLEKVVINTNCTFTDAQNSFMGCKSLKYPPTFPSTVTDMNSSFFGCSSLLTPPTIPSNVTNMVQTFKNCISLSKAPSIPSSVTDMDSTFYGCLSLATAPSLPSSVTNLSDTFHDCKALLKIPTIPSGVASLPNTFNGCTSISQCTTIPSNITSIADTFQNCSSLLKVTVPNTVTDVGSTFVNCTTLYILTMNMTTPPTYSSTLEGCTALNRIIVPSGSESTWKNTSGWSDFASIIVGV